MLLDTYAWVEIIKNSPAGRRTTEMLGNEGLATSIASIAELSSWAHRSGLNARIIIEKVKSASTILQLTEEIAELAGELQVSIKKDTPDWGMVDSMIYATAVAHGIKVITGDSHFRGKPNAVLI